MRVLISVQFYYLCRFVYSPPDRILTVLRLQGSPVSPINNHPAFLTPTSIPAFSNHQQMCPPFLKLCDLKNVILYKWNHTVCILLRLVFLFFCRSPHVIQSQTPYFGVCWQLFSLTSSSFCSVPHLGKLMRKPTHSFLWHWWETQTMWALVMCRDPHPSPTPSPQ